MDLDLLQKDIQSGKNMEEVYDGHFAACLRYPKGVENYMRLKQGKRVYQEGEAPKIYIFWGPSGTGKSRRAATDFPGAYWKAKGEWWQDYSGEEVVIFDEFYGWLPYDFLLRILDWYSLPVNLKGTSHQLKAKTFVFTSNVPWFEWYQKVRDQQALRRRILEFCADHARLFHMPGESGCSDVVAPVPDLHILQWRNNNTVEREEIIIINE